MDHSSVGVADIVRRPTALRQHRRRFLQTSAGLVGLGLLAGCSSLPFGAGRTRRIGILSLDNGEVSPWLKAYDAALKELGYIEGQNTVVERRIVPDLEYLEQGASELAATKPDIILGAGWWAAKRASDAMPQTPIVSITSDPVATNPPLVESLSRPG